jgi:hypothetical protein
MQFPVYDSVVNDPEAGSPATHADLVRRTMSLYRLNTGELTVFHDDGANDRGIIELQPMLRSGLHVLAEAESWSVDTDVASSMLIALVRNGNGPLVRMWLVLDGTDLAKVVPRPRVLDLPTPVCVVEVLRTLPYDPVVGWLRRMVETLAWAWLRHMAESPSGERIAPPAG